ncbi:hypothetical protein ACA910_017978 [Epithemia clementina (nom. ined.)]
MASSSLFKNSTNSGLRFSPISWCSSSLINRRPPLPPPSRTKHILCKCSEQQQQQQRRLIFPDPPRCFSSSSRREAQESSSSSSSSTAASTPTSTLQVDSTTNETKNVLMSGSTSKSLGSIVRHGRGDACIVLNVGGSEFVTLRSTVASNAVLADHVARAEENLEFMEQSMGNNRPAVFIDRDPKHFGFILQYLRNQVELEHSNLRPHQSSSSSPLAQIAGGTALSTPTTPIQMTRLLTTWKTKSFMPQLPKDPLVLAELYVEATYYRIVDLQIALQDQSMWTRLISFFGMSKVGGFQGNPFVRGTQVLAQLRNALVALGTLTAAGTMTVQQMGSEQVHKVMEWCGLASSPSEESGKIDGDGSNASNQEDGSLNLDHPPPASASG